MAAARLVLLLPSRVPRTSRAVKKTQVQRDIGEPLGLMARLLVCLTVTMNVEMAGNAVVIEPPNHEAHSKDVREHRRQYFTIRGLVEHLMLVIVCIIVIVKGGTIV